MSDDAYDAYVALGGDPNPEAYIAFRQRRLKAEREAVERMREAQAELDRQRERQRQEELRELEQRSGAEVPGFHARTVIDDTIGKLYALRNQLRVPLPEGIAALLDDIEELVEKAIDIAYDEDAEPVTVPAGLLISKSDCLTPCSCGGEWISPPDDLGHR